MAKAKKTELPTTSTTTTETIVDKDSTKDLDSTVIILEEEKVKEAETIVDTESVPLEEAMAKAIEQNWPQTDEEKEAAKPTVYTVSAKLYKHEKEYIDKILEARQTAVNNGKPLTRDMNHFIRQCIRFTVNHRKNAAFWLPAGIDETLIDT